MFCPMCGSPNEEDSIFCGNCGAVLNPEQAQGEATKAQAAEAVISEPKPVESPETPRLDERPPVPPPPAPSPARPSVPAVPTSGMAIASLVLGIGGLTVLPLLGSIVAIILGYMARRDIRQRPAEVSGDGLARAGIVLGWIAVGLAVMGLLVFGGITACGICGALSSANL
jgi:hypothetical protein